MRRDWGSQSLAPLLLLLYMLTVPGNGNEGSSAGSCRCVRTFSSDSPPNSQQKNYFRKVLKYYDNCTPLVRRFHLPGGTVCGSTRDLWVIELTSCFEQRECGPAYAGTVVPQKHLPPSSSQVPESTERAPAVTGISAHTYLPSTLQSTQQPTLPEGELSLDKKLTHVNETTTSSVGHSLEAGPEAGENEKQLEENVNSTAGTPATVPVLSLLVVSFVLTGVLFYVLCKRRSKQSLQYSPDLQLHCTPEAPDSQNLG